MVNNLKFKIKTPQEMGMTQDEYNNMLIDFWAAASNKEEVKGVLIAATSAPVTIITLTKNNYHK